MLDIHDNSPETMIEFENTLNGEISLIRAEDVKEWELQQELLRRRLVAGHLSSLSYLSKMAENPEEWILFASFVIGKAN